MALFTCCLLRQNTFQITMKLISTVLSIAAVAACVPRGETSVVLQAGHLRAITSRALRELAAAGISATAICAGSGHSCIIDNNGDVRCWGSNNFGKIGYGSIGSVGDGAGPSVGAAGTVDMGAGVTASKISCGASHVCVIQNSGGVRCWGKGTYRALGYTSSNNVGGVGTSVANAGTVDMGTGVTAKFIALGTDHTCVIDNSDAVRCWGRNNLGQLGKSNTLDIGAAANPVSGQSPVDMGTGVTAKAVAAGTQHTCVIDNSDNVRCWGSGSSGRLGYSSTSNVGDDTTRSVSAAGTVNLGSGLTANAIACGGTFTCIIDSSSGVRCWGSGADGALGTDSTNDKGSYPSNAVSGLSNIFGTATAIALSCGSQHSCAVKTGGDVICWGFGGSGRLGQGSTTNIGDSTLRNQLTSAAPVDLGSGVTGTAVTCGSSHTCAIDNSNAVHCWGLGTSGLGYDSAMSVGHTSSASVASAGTISFEAPTPTATPSSSPTPSASTSASFTPTASSTPSVSPTASTTASATPSASVSATSTPSSSQTAAPTLSATAASTVSQTAPPDASQTVSPAPAASQSVSPVADAASNTRSESTTNTSSSFLVSVGLVIALLAVAVLVVVVRRRAARSVAGPTDPDQEQQFDGSNPLAA